MPAQRCGSARSKLHMRDTVQVQHVSFVERPPHSSLYKSQTVVCRLHELIGPVGDHPRMEGPLHGRERNAGFRTSSGGKLPSGLAVQLQHLLPIAGSSRQSCAAVRRRRVARSGLARLGARSNRSGSGGPPGECGDVLCRGGADECLESLFVDLLGGAFRFTRSRQPSCNRARRRGAVQSRKALVFSGSRPASG